MQPRNPHPAPDSYAKSQLPHPSDHHRTRIVWLVVAGLVTALGVVAWLCSGEWAV